MNTLFETDAYVAPSTDPLDVLANLANEASARMERAEAALKESLETIEALKTQLATRCEIHEAAVEKAQTQRNELRDLLELQTQTVHDCIDNLEGRDHHFQECGNCVAGVPLPHSLGCRIKTALRGAR